MFLYCVYLVIVCCKLLKYTQQNIDAQQEHVHDSSCRPDDGHTMTETCSQY